MDEERGREEREERFEENGGARGELIEQGSALTRRGKHTVLTVSVIGQIEGHYALGDGQKSTKYEHLIPLLASAENSPEIDGILILLNTMGGDVEAGLALAELIAGMRTPSVSLVLGGGHSIGVPLAAAAKRSFIVPSATMTLHPVRSSGLVLGVYQSFTYFHRMQERIVRFISDHSAVKPERLTELMLKTDEIATDMGSIIDGEAAVREGLIDEIGGIAKALDALEKMMDENAAGQE